LLLASALLLVACVAIALSDEKPIGDSSESVQADSKRAAQVAMRELVERAEFGIVENVESGPRMLKRREKPLVTYGDETRAIKDSTLWVWMDGERPGVFVKLEVNDYSPTYPQWTWCITPANPQLTQYDFPDGGQKFTTTRGVHFQPVAGAKAPGSKSSAWSLEARSLSREFSAFTGPTQLRLVSRPVFEFKAPGQKVPYGAVFSYATGTNPDVLLILQIEETDAGQQWSYLPLHMTSADVTVKRGEEELWTEPEQRASVMSTWGYFFTKRDPAIQ
jgi:hypothetical protein